MDVRFEVFIAVTMRNPVFCDVTPCGSCKDRRFEGKYSVHQKRYKIGELGTTTAVTSNRLALSDSVASYCCNS
jgi:hypothetical protein